MTKQIISMSMAKNMPRPFANPLLRQARGKWSSDEREHFAMTYEVLPDKQYAEHVERQRRAARSRVEKAVDAVKERIADVAERIVGPAAADKKPRPQAPGVAAVAPKKRTFFT